VYSGEYHVNLKKLDVFFELEFFLWEGLGGRSVCVEGGGGEHSWRGLILR